jgi:regulator of protease activity HflC (stomatin/prohibitin superfamily)
MESPKSRVVALTEGALTKGPRWLAQAARALWASRAGRAVLVIALLAVLGREARHVFVGIEPGQGAVRINRMTGAVTVLPPGWCVALPGVSRIVRFPLREQIFRSLPSAVPFQSAEGLPVGAEVTVRYGLDPAKIREIAMRLPEDVGRELVAPVIDTAIYRVLAQHTVREIFSTARHDIEETIEKELTMRLASDGVQIRGVFLGSVKLPSEYGKGMERLLIEEMNADQMRYTLDLKEKQVKEAELEAEAEKVRRDKAAEAVGNQEVIAAKAKAEAMKHVLPFKEREIEQRRLEAEATRVARLKAAETEAEARRIEAQGEADSRRQLAEADAYRLDLIGKASSEQLAREGAAVSRNPLLIQKALADKLSDKIKVIITPPQAGFLAAGLLGIKDAGPRALVEDARPDAAGESEAEGKAR